MARRSFRFWSTLFTIALVISVILGQVSPLKAQTPDQDLLVKQGVKKYQQGKSHAAIAFWSQVIAHYQQQGDQQQLGRSLTEEAQAHSSLGQHRQAIAILCGESNHKNQCAEDSAIATISVVLSNL